MFGQCVDEVASVEADEEIVLAKEGVALFGCACECRPGWIVGVVHERSVGVTGLEVHDVGSLFAHWSVCWGGTFFSRPCIDILEDVSVDGFHVLVVEGSTDGIGYELTNSSGRVHVLSAF